MHVTRSWLTAIFTFFCALAQGGENQLVLNASPRVWHVDTSPRITLTMRYWGEISVKGEKGTLDDLVVKEFSHVLRLDEPLDVGAHVLGPYTLQFEGNTYTSNQLEVKVLPSEGSFRGVKAYFSQDSCAVNEPVQLVIMEYRNQERQLHTWEAEDSPHRTVYPHGGQTMQYKDAAGKKVWQRMRYYSVTFSKPGIAQLSEEDFKKPGKKKNFNASIDVIETK